MSLPKREQLKNDGITTLNGSLDNSQTSVVVTSGAVFPSSGNFRIRIEDEIMLVTSRSTNTLTVVRGYEGSSAVTHADTLDVKGVLTTDAVQRVGQDNVPDWGNSSAPAQGLFADNGSTKLTTSDFSAINAGHTTSFTDENGEIVLSQDAAGTGLTWRLWRISAPSPTWEYTARFEVQHFSLGGSDLYVGFGARESGTSKISVMAYYSSTGGAFRLGAFDNTTQTGNNVLALSNKVWLRVKYDGVNMKYSASYDGINFGQLRSVAVTTPFTTAPDQIVFGVVFNDGTSTDPNAIIRLTHLHRSV